MRLFNEVFHFAKTLTDFSERLQASKMLLFNDNKPWPKKFENEVCELVGSFILTKFCDVLHREYVRLYFDDGPSVVKQMLGPELERKRKKIIETFTKYGLVINIKTNLFVANFLIFNSIY